MFSLLLSSDEDFSMPIDTQKPNPATTSQPSLLPSPMPVPGPGHERGHGPPVMSFPELPATPTLQQPFPTSGMHLALPPLHAQHRVMGFNPVHTGLNPTPSPSPPSVGPWPPRAFPFPAPISDQWEKRKRCSDDEVQFVSEKPVKKRRLASIGNGTLMNPQQKGLTTHPAQPAHPVQQAQSLATGPTELNVNSGPPPPPPPPPNTAPVFTAPPPPPPEPEPEADFLNKDPAISAMLAKFSFPKSLSIRTAARRMSLAPLSPKSLPDTMPPDLLQRGRSGPATVATGGIDERASPSATPTFQNGISAVLDVNMLSPPVLATDSTRTTGDEKKEAAGLSEPPTGGIDKLQIQPESTVADVSQGQRATPVHKGTAWDGTDAINGRGESRPPWEQGQPHRVEAAARYSVDQTQDRQETSAPVAPVIEAVQPINAATSAPLCDVGVGVNDISGDRPWPQHVPGPTANANANANTAATNNNSMPVNAPIDQLQQRENPAPQPTCTPSSSIAQPTISQAQTLNGQGHIGVRPQLHLQTRTPSPTQAHHNGSHHSAAPGQAKGPCLICAKKRQQAALQKANSSNQSISQFPHGHLPHQGVGAPHGAAAHGVTGYNVMLVPTPMQSPTALGSGQFAGAHTMGHANGGNSGVMGLPSQHQFLMQNPQAQGMMVPGGMAISNNGQSPMDTSSSMMMNQGGQVPPTSMPRTQAHQQQQQQQQQQQTQQMPKKFIHQEPSPGKHIIVDIADTAMDVFPFNKVARRHGVSPDKVRNIFEAVVAVPFLRVPADKRRAAKIGQERVKKYLIAKKELEKQQQQAGGGGGSGGGGGRSGEQQQQASVYEIARAMGPEDFLPSGWAQGYGGLW